MLTAKTLLSRIEAKEHLSAWVMIAPATLAIGLVVLYPVIATFVLSMRDVSLIRPDEHPFIWFQNYRRFFSGRMFWDTVGRTGYFTLVSVGLELVLGVAVAVLLNMRLRGWRFLRTAIIIPWAVPTIVNALMWKWIYNADFGALNALLKGLGLIHRYRAWLASPWAAMNLVILADIWHCVPLVVLIVGAALATIPADIYEAAAIDGARPWQTFWRITLPLLRPALLVVLVLRTVEAFKVFDIVYVITGGGPANGTLVIAYQTYLEAFSFLHMGRGAALSFIVSVFILMLALLYTKLLYTEDTVVS